MKKHLTRLVILFAIALTLTQSAFATDKRGRLGVGMNNQFANDLTALAFKLQKSGSFAMQGLLAVNTDDDAGGYGAGLKFFRILFDEPQLDFYSALMVGVLKQETLNSQSYSGFQIDVTLGSEFHFSGLSSLGFSLEFGASLYKLDNFIVKTVGHNFLVAGILFYL